MYFSTDVRSNTHTALRHRITVQQNLAITVLLGRTAHGIGIISNRSQIMYSDFNLHNGLKPTLWPLNQRSCQSYSCAWSSASLIDATANESSFWSPSVPTEEDSGWLTGFDKLCFSATVNNGAPFDSSASLEARRQKSSKSSVNQGKNEKEDMPQSINVLSLDVTSRPRNWIKRQQQQTFVSTIKSNCQGWINWV